ncbi:MAG: 2-oxoacid:acceptor oxidoreductase subunit alpha [Deltaproteobacteria bacterium HGW-Deltaproteobacteria-13]|jgi:2-oxoglutarate ferredoxin oxidoreductase subunit alpha|nr:MAG: 2-oxoacid:acceptor oxidoreductase subunit alpha [Deltaproteobacteria bacterium HGW-Deltaproteobacteria-13]
MPSEISVRITGEAGQGTQTIGDALSHIFKSAGYHLFAYQDFMSRIRGGNNFFEIRVATKPVHAPRRKPDIIICLDKSSVDIHKKDLAIDGILIVDQTKFRLPGLEESMYDVAFNEIALRVANDALYVNSIACGLIAGLAGLDFAFVEQGIQAVFDRKSKDIIQNNLNSARAGFDLGLKNPRKKMFLLPVISKDRLTDKAGEILLDGSSAIALGAVHAGCKFYTAYPMSPSTNIMNIVAEHAAREHIIVEQAEDEIAAINMAIGASFAGSRAMTSTSGGGFCLMTEGLSLAGMTETPIVMVDAQRPGPATGFPTRTEQADLDFVLSAGHGEFARVVYAPGSAKQAYDLTMKAFNIAEKYQIPVIILTDQHLQDSATDAQAPDQDNTAAERFIISKEESAGITSYKRYALTDSGISPRAIPSWIQDVMYVDSDEHDEAGHITEDAEMRKQMVQKRLYKKLHGLLQELEQPTSFNTKDARVILLGFGSTLGILQEAALALEKSKVGFVHLPQVWPFPSEEMLKLLSGARMIISIENNAQGQLARLLRRETGIKVGKSILKYDGRPFDIDSVIEIIKRELEL